MSNTDSHELLARLRRAEDAQDAFHEWARPIIAINKAKPDQAVALTPAEVDKLIQIQTASMLSRDLRA